MKAAAAICALVIAAPAVAHDFWIEPTTFHPRSGGTVGLALHGGEKFRGTGSRNSSRSRAAAKRASRA